MLNASTVTIALHNVAVLISGRASPQLFVLSMQSAQLHVFPRLLLSTTFLCLSWPRNARDATDCAVEAGLFNVVERPHSNALNSLTQHKRLEDCFGFAKKHEQFQTTAFTHFMKIRPDFEWKHPLASIGDFSTRAVSARARLALFDPPQVYPKSAYSYNFDALQFNEHSFDGACMQWGGKQRNTTIFRKTGMSQCVLLDDQVLVVPASVSDAFFKQSFHPLPITHQSVLSYGMNTTEYTSTCNLAYAERGNHVTTIWGEHYFSQRCVERNIPIEVVDLPGMILNEKSPGHFQWPIAASVAVACGVY